MRLTKIYTKAGDGGITQLATGDRVSKACLRIETYGTIDELNATIGVLRDEIVQSAGDFDRAGSKDILEWLSLIQNELFDLGGELSMPSISKVPAGMQVVGIHEITRLESQMDAMNEHLPPLKNFILPGGHRANSFAHLARTICRRAERCLVRLSEAEETRGEALIYLNRLSDWLFVVCRELSFRLCVREVLWNQRGK